MDTKYIFVAGGVMSGIGKGITIASIGRILKSKSYKVEAIKIDPYINVDAGTMNPIEHGEVFVTDDGDECDQDIGNYERFLGQNLSRLNYMTTGRVYRAVIEKERNLGYKGKCVQVVPHIPEEVMRRIKKIEKEKSPDFILVEIGGTVGEYENLIFLETARMLKLKKPKSVLFVLVSFLPIPRSVGEMKTKPTQHAVRTINKAGIQPDIIIARSELPIDKSRKKKISIFCNVSEEDVISAPDETSIYKIPVNFEKDKLGNKLLRKFDMPARKNDLVKWKKFLEKIEKPKKTVKIGIVGKYFKTDKFTLIDSYISVIEAVKHAAAFCGIYPDIVWIDAEVYEKSPSRLKEIDESDGIIVPGGFGDRGVEGKIKAANYARKNNIPFLGLCLGMQIAVIEFARNELKLKQANSSEFFPNCEEAVIAVMEEQKEKLKNKNYGGTMRLGSFKCRLGKGSRVREIYREDTINERHRHRYEFNNKYREKFNEKGLKTAGINPDSDLVEIVELEKHPFFIGVQFHPEFKSKPLEPHPLFGEFMRIASKR